MVVNVGAIVRGAIRGPCFCIESEEPYLVYTADNVMETVATVVSREGIFLF